MGLHVCRCEMELSLEEGLSLEGFVRMDTDIMEEDMQHQWLLPPTLLRMLGGPRMFLGASGWPEGTQSFLFSLVAFGPLGAASCLKSLERTLERMPGASSL